MCNELSVYIIIIAGMTWITAQRRGFANIVITIIQQTALTLSVVQSMMHVQQNRCPHGVAEMSRRVDKHNEHFPNASLVMSTLSQRPPAELNKNS